MRYLARPGPAPRSAVPWSPVPWSPVPWSPAPRFPVPRLPVHRSPAPGAGDCPVPDLRQPRHRGRQRRQRPQAEGELDRPARHRRRRAGRGLVHRHGDQRPTTAPLDIVSRSTDQQACVARVAPLDQAGQQTFPRAIARPRAPCRGTASPRARPPAAAAQRPAAAARPAGPVPHRTCGSAGRPARRTARSRGPGSPRAGRCARGQVQCRGQFRKDRRQPGDRGPEIDRKRQHPGHQERQTRGPVRPPPRRRSSGPGLGHAGKSEWRTQRRYRCQVTEQQPDIDGLRQGLDEVDSGIVRLIAQRREVIAAIAKAKEHGSAAIQDAERERRSSRRRGRGHRARRLPQPGAADLP